ncbi:thiamine pyrophosphate-binding protein [Porphyromonas endodontalis]|uniref:Thiamine pyrophosphate enzyme N-terminal TPP-binding domain-containing protein n=1 Tax=Porphyromonas endodontalis (strain ATCC 35406 / DSM 24491 / JCM 8526 / CCUG 16442 / BCRC 14492 / NCTC 13058 / HG 370) TaxID=553175 RepID=C3JAP5_POREA|nr:thiamine pyrophosphate-binding protein [Porphyromonas endodontalis]EEN82799.1 hypothetical protein POREN0001_0282 [Porphyromonas endodontalis ATCC 35406]UBH65130.1 2-succinyl-5-enolpyruvyl-6-hydroxy-3-cyclohexene-1-carboxylate synthase [Porphyromonas endodontalis]SUB68262.1 2-succinyl-5-enolpyruvyl-6-hydroxy-3-cyclohexene-1-carboxylate synthase [Porphyromonas endodontalis]
MEFHYTSEKNHQILIALLKKKGIRYIIASPGATNVSFLSSVQSDPFFKIFSSVDERSAAYIACGMAAERQEPVVLSCTGATASRNYYPGMTEAFYRKLPIIAVTSTQISSRIGQHVPQVLDRRQIANDVALYSTTLPIVKDQEDFASCEAKVNEALIALTRKGGGPIHINIETSYSRNYGVKELPTVREIHYHTYTDIFPEITASKVGISIGSHVLMDRALVESIEFFCKKYNAIVFCDHTSGYYGKYKVVGALIGSQKSLDLHSIEPELVLHIGEVSGDYPSTRFYKGEVWRISEDGNLRDTFGKLSHLFEVAPKFFFDFYNKQTGTISREQSYHQTVQSLDSELRSKFPEVPFSNVWVAQQVIPLLPSGSSLHLGILNSLRAWNLFPLPQGVDGFSNVGGFGIDGGLSSCFGAALARPEKLFFIAIGDLAFFYDMNVLGNRHLGKNLRILLFNNGVGTEFRNYNHRAAEFGEDADAFMAARGHYGNKSPLLVKHFAEDLGFEYLSASSKEEFNEKYHAFVAPEIGNRPLLFEVFTDSQNESDALEQIANIKASKTLKTANVVGNLIRENLGNETFESLKGIAKKILH